MRSRSAGKEQERQQQERLDLAPDSISLAITHASIRTTLARHDRQPSSPASGRP